MLPVRDPDGSSVARWSLINTIALVALCLLPYALSLAGTIYAVVTALLGLWFLMRAVAFTRPATRDAQARKLFFTSIAWLPLQLGILVVDRLMLS
jgi:protoheme IX farnesyltransferase